MFYTSYYHTLINPSLYCDVDGRYRGLDGNVHEGNGRMNYTVFSLWDTYRAEHPFLLLMKPDRAKDMISSMLSHYDQSVHGLLPIWSLMGNEGWCMSGYHAVSVLSDAIVKGLDIDTDKALEAMVSTSKVGYLDGLGEYIKKGYVPMESSSTSASNTLEYSYDDFAIFSAASYLGRTDIASEYAGRADNYLNVFDIVDGFAKPRSGEGEFKTPFNPLRTDGEGFIEGNSWNFSFHAPQDVNGLIGLMGGDKAFIKRLDDLFTMDLPEIYYKDNEDITKECLLGGYVHGNEPSHHVPYLYAWTSQPWKGQSLLRKIMTSMYRNSMDGLSGNDDCGQMSAWYIFSAMGFYPVAPGSDQYVFGAPYLPHILLHLENGKNLEIKAEGLSDKNCYVKSVTLNGKKLERLYITHAELMEGGVLEYEMSSKPSKKRGLRPEEKPYSLTSISR
jgi:predicted alpha-1,2-mannosidase